MMRLAILVMLTPLMAACSPAFHDLGTPAPLSVPQLHARTSQLIAPPGPTVVRFEDRPEMASTSLWSGDYVQLFRDQRAFREGDILTVRILMNDKAAFKNVSERETEASGGITADGTYSIHDSNPSASLDANIGLSGSAQRGGTIDRAERISLLVAAVVVHASPNGNLVIAGTQEVRVNHELRLLTVEGVVRASDILPDNTIPYERMAEARISYGGSNTRTHPEYGRWGKPGYRTPGPMSFAPDQGSQPVSIAPYPG